MHTWTAPRIAAATLLLGAVSTASAQSFNLDFGSSAGSPSAGFGGPAESPGVWNVIEAGPTSFSLADLNGDATGVTMESTWFFRDPNLPAFTPHNPQPSTAFDPDVAALLDDFYYLDGDVQTEIIFLGLQPGLYDLVVTGILVGAPDEPTAVTWLSDDFADFQEDVTGDGPYTGAWEQSVTHTRMRVPVGPSGEMHVFANGIFNFEFESFGNLNGIQLVQVPEPATLALLTGIALLAGRSRR